MLGQQTGKKSGSFDENEISVIIKHVLHHNPEAVNEVQRNTMDWKAIGEKVNRHWISVWKVYQNSIQPTIRRHLAGTLEEDVRGQLIRKARERGWNTRAQFDFHQLAEMSEFRGHTSCSLELLYASMLGNLVEKRKELRSKREVSLDMVEEWWATTTRRRKSSNIKAKEQAIVSAYNKVIGSMEREHKLHGLQEKFRGEIR